MSNLFLMLRILTSIKASFAAVTPIATVCTLVLLLGACNAFLSADERVERARVRVAAGDYQSAAIELRNALQNQPDHIPARLLLAQVSLKQGDAVAADKELRRAIELGAKPRETAQLTAQVGLALGRAEELLIQIDSDELPLDEPLRSIYRGEALLTLQQPGAAFNAFSLALKSDSKSKEARRGLAEALAQNGRTHEALATLDRLLAEEATDTQALLLRGRILSRRGQLAEAEQALVAAQPSIAELSPLKRVLLLATLAETRLARGDIPGARRAQQQLAEIAANFLITRILAARISMASQDYAGASAELQRVVTAMPNAASARFLLGAALLAQGSLNQAESQLTRAVQAAPENLEARKLLAQARLRLDQPDAAMEVLLPAQQLEETDPQVNTLLGLAHLQLGNEVNALAYLEKSAAAKPDDWQTQMSLAATYLRAGEHKKAIGVLKSIPHQDQDARREGLLLLAIGAGHGLKAAEEEVESLLRMYPENIGILNVCASYFANLGEYERARATLAKALAVAPHDTATMLNAARLEAAAGDLSAAYARLEGVIANDSNNSTARLALAELSERRGDLPGAIKWLNELRQQDPQAFPPRLRLARLFLNSKRTKEADDLLREVSAAASARHDVLNAIGLLYLDSGRFDEAISKFQAAANLDSGNAAYWLNLARAQLAIERRVLARESLEKARESRPDSIAVVGALVLLDIQEGKRDEAARRIARLKHERSGDANVLVLEGDYHMTLKQYAQADKAYGMAVQMRSDVATALKQYRARSLGKLGAITEPLENWLSLNPEDFATQAVLAEAYQRGGEQQRAIETYELIVHHRPSSAAALNNLAWLYHLNDDRRAELTALRAYRLAPAIPAIADTYGWILVQNKKLQSAVPILRQAAESGNGQPDITYHYAAALARSGAVKEARERLVNLLGADADFASKSDAERLLQDLSN